MSVGLEFMLASFGLLDSRCRGGSERPDSDFRAHVSTTQNVEQAEEDRLPRVPGQQPIDQPATGADNLTRQTHKGIHKGLEFHREDRLLLFAVLLGDVTTM